jgi:hypothetical protein
VETVVGRKRTLDKDISCFGSKTLENTVDLFEGTFRVMDPKFDGHVWF